MSDKCDLCGREKWEYSGPARKPTNCMQDYDWCPDDSAAEHWRLAYERERARANVLAEEMEQVSRVADMNKSLAEMKHEALAAAITARDAEMNESDARVDAAEAALAAARRECEGLRAALTTIQAMARNSEIYGDAEYDAEATAALAAPAAGEEWKR